MVFGLEEVMWIVSKENVILPMLFSLGVSAVLRCCRCFLTCSVSLLWLLLDETVAVVDVASGFRAPDRKSQDTDPPTG